MVPVAPPKHLRLRQRHRQRPPVLMAKILIAFLWCIVIILFASMPKEEEDFLDVVDNTNVLVLVAHSKDGNSHSHSHSHSLGASYPRPRAAMILVATQDLNLPDPLESMKKSIRSILSHTDPDRIFAICAVFQQGVLTETQQEEAQIELDKLGLNAIKTSSQWHGINKYSYSNSSNDDNDGHGIFNAIFVNNNSTSESDIRNQYDLAQYIQILLKYAQEKDILTLFVRPDSEIETNNWVDTVSHFPMHTIESTDEEKTHNAISFTARSNETIGPLKLKSIKLHTLEEAMSYPTSTGMGLETLLKLPTKPLREINQHIISTAKMMDLQFVNVSGHFKEHPHQGALDENGNPGYIHDEKALHKNPPPFTFTKEQVQCAMKDGNYKMLTEKVFVDLAAHEHAESLAKSGIKPRPKLFCLVYTIEKNHDRIPAIRETWGNKCDGFMVGSTKTDEALGTVNIPHEGPEQYDNIWQKVRSLWSYIYDNYYEEYDWFHIGGDDLYVLVENLRLYLESEEIQLAANGGEFLPTSTGAGIEKPSEQLPLYLGCRFKQHGDETLLFNTGGSGYTLNKAALKALVMAFPTCLPHLKIAAEDAKVAECFREKWGVFPFDTKDDEGGERYMHLQPDWHLTFRPPEKPKDHWFSLFSIDSKTGLDHCAARSIAFHYINGNLMKRMHAILYGHCA